MRYACRMDANPYEQKLTLLQACALLLPALMPSWRFFGEILPSPRVEYALLEQAEDVPQHWQEFRPRPQKLSRKTMLKRLFWNPQWNESLFVMSCAERLMDQASAHSKREIFTRIAAEVKRQKHATVYLQFRLVFISRSGAHLQREIPYLSPVRHLSEGRVP